MIENLPDVDDPSYEEAYKVAQNSSAQVYVGKYPSNKAIISALNEFVL
jgi:phage terminase large subunit